MCGKLTGRAARRQAAAEAQTKIETASVASDSEALLLVINLRSAREKKHQWVDGWVAKAVRKAEEIVGGVSEQVQAEQRSGEEGALR